MPEFIDPVFTKTSPKRSFSLNRKQAFWLVFVKTGSIISGTGSFSGFCLSLGYKIPCGLFTPGSFYPRVFLPCGVCKFPSFKGFGQMARFSFFADFSSIVNWYEGWQWNTVAYFFKFMLFRCVKEVILVLVRNWKLPILRWYAQSESIIIKTHSKTIVLQDYRFYLLVFFLYCYLQSRGVKL